MGEESENEGEGSKWSDYEIVPNTPANTPRMESPWASPRTDRYQQLDN